VALRLLMGVDAFARSGASIQQFSAGDWRQRGEVFALR